MATFVPSPDLDPSVAKAIQDAMDALRGELLGHLAPRASSPAAPVEGAGGDRIARLEAAVEALDRASTQTELLTCLLQEAGAFADRSIFLVRDAEALNGWAAFGFVGGDADVSRVVVASPNRVLEGFPAENSLAGQRICEQMIAPPAAESLMAPFILRSQTAGVLYADRLSKAVELDRPALRVLCYIAAQTLETLPLRHGTQGVVPVTRDVAAPEVEDVEAELDRMIEDVVPGPPAEEPDEVDVDSMIEEVERDTRVVVGDEDIVAIRQEVSPVPFDREEAAVDDADRRSDAETQEAATVETEVEPAPRPAVEMSEAEVAPPDDLEGPGWAFSGANTISDDNRHEEARRLARLLVTEIKLYNEEKVRQGRENHDVYEQLRDDIERSRRIYTERIDDEIREEADYFQEEVLRILAGGDSSALGI
jgi:hypothetical protein